jgi:1,4-alpha-glucan branching enzyme
MGDEFAQPGEWNHEAELDWSRLGTPAHRQIADLVTALNRLYRDHPALHAGDCRDDGFQWIIGDDDANSVYAFLREAPDVAPVLVVANFTPVPRTGYRIGVPVAGAWRPLLESDDSRFGGSGTTNRAVATAPSPAHGFDQSLDVVAGPLAISFFTPSG